MKVVFSTFQRQARGWHDDDAAWEAFLNQADDGSGLVKNNVGKNSRIPSMVCGPPADKNVSMV